MNSDTLLYRIDFAARNRKGVEIAAGELNDLANARGWQHRPNP